MTPPVSFPYPDPLTGICAILPWLPGDSVGFGNAAFPQICATFPHWGVNLFLLNIFMCIFFSTFSPYLTEVKI